MTDKRTPREQTLKELGKFIEDKMKERDERLKEKGFKPLSRTDLAGLVDVSKVWMSDIINGNKSPTDKLLLKIANVLEIDEHEIFKVARRIHPDIQEENLQEYLGEYYIEGINE